MTYIYCPAGKILRVIYVQVCGTPFPVIATHNLWSSPVAKIDGAFLF